MRVLLDRFGGSEKRGFAADAIAEDAAVVHLLEINAVERILDHVILDRGVMAGDEDGRVIVGEAQTRAGNAQSAQGDMIGRDGDDVAGSVAANFGARLAEETGAVCRS